MRPLPKIDLRPHFLTLRDLPAGPINWQSFFGNDHPVELEVGCGRGLFLQTSALVHPDRNYLGVEYDMKEARRAALRLHKRALPNVRVLGANVFEVLPKFIPDQSVAAVHVYFPDPWWKRRHRKRRVFSATFLSQVTRVLPPGGWLHSWTDVEEYFGVITELVNSHPAFVWHPPPEEREAQHDLDYHTSFERKKRQLGLPIYRARWQRNEIANTDPRLSDWLAAANAAEPDPDPLSPVETAESPDHP
ncbi:MAG: tRNA (guanosine(46)-N7)-methyltransferase TrmB [Planctomycetales bacterium]|nr:tRNA (guanosine(46)-N7)-methyltransferase TrmB [Planctomycetales bacterium]